MHAEGGQAADAISIATAKALSFGGGDEQTSFAQAIAAAIAQSGCDSIKPVIASKISACHTSAAQTMQLVTITLLSGSCMLQ
jgi:hypothetical protein